MIRHVVMFTWNDDVTEAEVAAFASALDSLPPIIPTIVSYRHGSDLGINQGNFDYVVVGDFDDEAGYRAYRDDPAHQAVIEAHVKGRVAQRAAVQFSFDMF